MIRRYNESNESARRAARLSNKSYMREAEDDDEDDIAVEADATDTDDDSEEIPDTITINGATYVKQGADTDSDDEEEDSDGDEDDDDGDMDESCDDDSMDEDDDSNDASAAIEEARKRIRARRVLEAHARRLAAFRRARKVESVRHAIAAHRAHLGR